MIEVRTPNKSLLELVERAARFVGVCSKHKTNFDDDCGHCRTFLDLHKVARDITYALRRRRKARR